MSRAKQTAPKCNGRIISAPVASTSLPALEEECSQHDQDGCYAGESNGKQNNEEEDYPSSFVCEWEGCAAEKVYDDAAVFWEHLRNHVPENPAGPCKWRGCAASGGSRSSRLPSKFMINHIFLHVPKQSFKCLMQNCKKRFDTPESLNNHMAKHPQPKTVTDGDCLYLEASDSRKIVEMRAQSSNFLSRSGEVGSLEATQRDSHCQTVLSDLGIVLLGDDYYVSVHGQPCEDVQWNGNQFGQTYKLILPFKPAWMKAMKVHCTMNKEKTSPNGYLLWKVPLSSPLFHDALRMFVREIIKRTEATGMKPPSLQLNSKP